MAGKHLDAKANRLAMNPPPILNRSPASPLIGVCIQYPSAGIIEAIGGEWDWVWIDAQHGELDYSDVIELVRACHLVGIPGLVRIPSHDDGWVGRVLDAGAAGIIVPMIESLAEARAMVAAAKFPPIGNRSYGGRRIANLLGRTYVNNANRDTVLILHVESNEAVALSEELAAIKGVDGLFVGPNDLLLRSGHSIEEPQSRETIGRQTKQVADACRAHGKLGLCVGISPSAMAMAREFGYPLIVGGLDSYFIAQGSKQAAATLRGFLAEGGFNSGRPPQT